MTYAVATESVQNIVMAAYNTVRAYYLELEPTGDCLLSELSQQPAGSGKSWQKINVFFGAQSDALKALHDASTVVKDKSAHQAPDEEVLTGDHSLQESSFHKE